MNTDLTETEREHLLNALKALYEVAKKQSQTSFDIDGRPLTKKDFSILNRARAHLDSGTTQR